MPLTPQDFVAKWKQVTARERQIAQEHFIDCGLAGHPTPLELGEALPNLGKVTEGRRGSARTLTNLDNVRPTWLDMAHKKLDAAALKAYGWPAACPMKRFWSGY